MVPLSLCIEDLAAKHPEERYLRCVALPGRQAGLGVDEEGRICWQEGDLVAEIWVSADGRPILYRRSGSASCTLTRAGRALLVPSGKPVVLVARDELEVGPRRLRIHLHGAANAVQPPERLVLSPRRAKFRVAATAALAMGATWGATSLSAGQEPPTDARAEDADVDDAEAWIDAMEGGVDAEDADAPIEIRDNPPEPPPPPPPFSGCCSKHPAEVAALARRKR